MSKRRNSELLVNISTMIEMKHRFQCRYFWFQILFYFIITMDPSLPLGFQLLNIRATEIFLYLVFSKILILFFGTMVIFVQENQEEIWSILVILKKQLSTFIPHHRNDLCFLFFHAEMWFNTYNFQGITSNSKVVIKFERLCLTNFSKQKSPKLSLEFLIKEIGNFWR